MWQQAYLRLRSLFRRHRQESELDEEIRFHLANETEELMAAGMSAEEARAAARRDFGNVTLIRELTREAWGWAPAERFLPTFAPRYGACGRPRAGRSWCWSRSPWASAPTRRSSAPSTACSSGRSRWPTPTASCACAGPATTARSTA